MPFPQKWGIDILGIFKLAQFSVAFSRGFYREDGGAFSSL
jgi:hypothetical protein